MHNASRVLAAKIHDCSRQIERIRRAPALIVDHIQGWPGSRQLQDRFWKTLATRAKQPRRSRDTAVGQLFQPNLRLRLGTSIHALGIARVVSFVRLGLVAIKNVIRTEEEQFRTALVCRSRDIQRSVAVHCKCEILMTFTSVDVRICGCEHDPVRSMSIYSFSDL